MSTTCQKYAEYAIYDKSMQKMCQKNDRKMQNRLEICQNHVNNRQNM